MSTITFSTGTIVPAAWLNDVNGLVYNGTVISTQLLGPLGSVASPTYSFAAETGTGLFRRASGTMGIQVNGNSVADFNALGNGGLYTNQLSLDRTNGDVILVRDAANVLAQKNSTIAQTIRIYGSTTGTKYLSLGHDGTNGVIDTAATSGILSIGPTNATGVTITPSLIVGGATLVQRSASANTTTVAADANKHLLHPTADNNPRTFTIDSNANVAYTIGTAITFVNQINTLTIAITSDTMTLASVGTTGSRTLGANGIATAIKIAATNWIISGQGLT